ncbi:hypothetical protein [Helicobacter cappadocius]|uniref:HNH endonuclease n=1 Tax=Helicobacter cappadocius TaxID=3063998 RepID=A0AA90Q1Z8_9HELI|nr:MULTISPECIES: hypothetical protein [unclassified Helicobacter]MDO7253136.1 hypothetical protein [Helicobacter sp. faydin-H75]MDP2538738.1 hypothetical protein [Helicobacter sp. faydin-H76]
MADIKSHCISDEEFEKIKKEHKYRCAICGSVQGQPHFLRTNIIIELHQGCKDPKKDMTADNIIPQCQICHRWSN